MARSNRNTRQSTRLSLLKAGAHKSDACAPKEVEPNPLKIANMVLALKKLNNLLAWLVFDGNFTKLIKFIIAVCDKYNELAADYKNLDADRNNQLVSKSQKEAVIQYF